MLARKIFWILTFLLMTVIFIFSSRPGDLSIQDSAWFLDKAKIMDEEEALDTSNMQAMVVQRKIRKADHIILFASLAMLIYASIYGYAGKALESGVISWLLTILFAISDEIHQYFVPGRSAQLQDVIRDGKGALIGCLLMMILFLIIERLPQLQRFINKIYNFNADKIFLKTASDG